MNIKKMLTRFLLFKLAIAIFIVGIILTSCNNNPKEDSEENDTLVEEGLSKEMKNVFYTLPSPFELSQMLKRAGCGYIYEILNPVQNVGKYSTEKKKALNLGVYGADLSYASIFNQTQETILYMKCSKELSDGLGISSTFKQKLIDRINKNIDNKDSLLQIISDSFYDTDEFLKQNERPSTAILVLAGGWIEGLYLSTKLAELSKNNSEIITRIGEQKYSLENLVALLENYKDDPNISELLVQVKELKQIYDKMEVSSNKSEPVVSKGRKSPTIGLSNSLNLSKDLLKEITQKVGAIRAEIVK